MTAQQRSDELAQLRAELAAQQLAFAARLARLERRRRFPSRFRPLALVGLLVALLPLAILAADPIFSDLGAAAPVHRTNIQAIGNAGITTGFADPADPTTRLYDPKGLVTREEMASFLARTAGLGGNPPVANAKTVGGYAPQDLVRVARGASTAQYGTQFDTTKVFPSFEILPHTIATLVAPGDGFVLVSITVEGLTATADDAAVIRIRDTTPGADPNAASPFVYSGFDTGSYHALSAQWVFPVTGAGPKTFALEVAQSDGASTADVGFFNGVITALYVPFGSGGAAALGGAPPAPVTGPLKRP